MNNSKDTIGNRTRDLPVFNTVPQPTAPLLTPLGKFATTVIKNTPLSVNTVEEAGDGSTTAISMDKFLGFLLRKWCLSLSLY
jgi:hypothetical protein